MTKRDGLKSPQVVESAASMFHYHLRLPGEQHAMCGARVFATSIPLSGWGARTHIGDWCERCAGRAALANAEKK